MYIILNNYFYDVMFINIGFVGVGWIVECIGFDLGGRFFLWFLGMVC